MDFIKEAVVPRIDDVLLMIFFGFMTVASLIAQRLFVSIDETTREPVDNFFSNTVVSVLEYVDNLPLTDYLSLSFVWMLIGIVAFSAGIYFVRSFREVDSAAKTIFYYHKPTYFSTTNYLGDMLAHTLYHIVTILMLFYYLKVSFDNVDFATTIVQGVIDSEGPLLVVANSIRYTLALAAWYYLAVILLRLVSVRTRVLLGR